MIISESYYTQAPLSAGLTRIDPTRIAAGAMTGVGFLGAGVIIKTGVSVQGLTTAACIWIVSAIGLAVGAGQYVAAITGSVITFFALWFLRIIEGRIPRLVYKYIKLTAAESVEEEKVRAIFEKRGFEVVKMDYDIEFPKEEKTFIFTVASRDGMSMKGIIEDISAAAFTKRLEIKS
jgi:putative Mg2+ transporter-C (MgtC) family protein